MLRFSERVQAFEGCMNMNHTFENIWDIFGEGMGMGSTLPALFALAAIPKLCDLKSFVRRVKVMHAKAVHLVESL